MDWQEPVVVQIAVAEPDTAVAQEVAEPATAVAQEALREPQEPVVA